ncbi:IQ domain-containing protein K [Nilaparvata lugens]|uniref:IQ domain-containing protein K n=1 Tax=Nilaparvata lugens TaxID=108931 RepID=UPI00193E405B|nr:IQ domain-containing protein K [Nilaparvata lugens]
MLFYYFSENLKLFNIISDSRRRKDSSSQHDELNYLNKEVFPILLQCLLEVLEKTKAFDSFYSQRLTYNGIDYLSELLYNCNPRHPLRTKKRLLKIPFVQKWLVKHPWKQYGSGVGWSVEMAAIVIQAHIRGYLVRCRADIQEVRNFWKTLKRNKEISDNRNGIGETP